MPLQEFPQIYDPANIGKLYLPNMLEAVKQGESLQLTPSEQDNHKILLLLIDNQIDFVFPSGSLAVPGALEDTRRVIEWLYRNLSKITDICASLDSHNSLQIFSPTWWVNQKGENPEPYTPITASEVRNGTWLPLYDIEWSKKYVEELEKGGRYSLMIWPYHTLLGSPGHTLVPALSEAIMLHAAARHSQPDWRIKGLIPQTEYYSIFEPEVKIPDHPQGSPDYNFLNKIASYDAVYIAGQAKSHCVLSSLRSLMQYYQNRPDIISNLYLLMDCTSSVQHPTIDFDKLATTELQEMSKLGLNLVMSSDPIIKS